MSRSVQYLGSYPRVEKCPTDLLPEYAFIGRSNVGKSSLINMLLERKDIARVSATPGKTQMLNFYRVDETWSICDLPGYGYAKLSKKHRRSMEQMVRNYLRRRTQMQCAFVLVDSNIPPQRIDLDFMNWLGAEGIPFVIVYTKADRAKPARLIKNLEAIEEAILEQWEELPRRFVTSAKDSRGQDELMAFIDAVNERFEA